MGRDIVTPSFLINFVVIVVVVAIILMVIATYVDFYKHASKYREIYGRHDDNERR